QALVTIVELNPYDVVNQNFLSQYDSSMDESDYSVVLVNKDSIKDNSILLGNIENEVKRVFNHKNFVFISDIASLESYLFGFKSLGFNLLFMISPDHNSINVNRLADKFLINY